MDASEDSQTDDVQTETHIDDTNGRSSPVLAQTPATIACERERSQSRDGNTRRRRGVGTNRGRSSSKSVSPDRRGGRAGRNETLTALHTARQNRVRASSGDQSRSPTRSRSPVETPVPDRRRGGRAGRK